MSGGRFDYVQNRLPTIADALYALADDPTTDYSIEERHKFRQTAYALETAAIMLQRCDWFLCGDDGPESFARRWQKDLARRELP